MHCGHRHLTVFTLVLILSGCANLPWYSRPRDHVKDETTEVVTVYYATSRAKVGGDRIESFYSWNKSDTLVHGTCTVEFPPAGEEPEFSKKDGLKYRDDVGAFYRTLNEQIGATDKPLLVFVHGFGVPFSNAILSTAALSRNLDGKFVPLSYSWPSLGQRTKSAYNFDRERRDFAARELVKFLKELQQHLPGRRIDLVAHSMGCHVLLRACEIWPVEESPPFENIVLAAADVDVNDFKRDLAPHASRVGKRCTLYASDGDKALVFAIRNVYRGETRAGYVWRGHDPSVCIVQGVDTVDVSEVDNDLVGHGYILGNSIVRNDLFHLLANNLSPGMRNLRGKTQEDGKYYLLRE